MVIVRPRFYYRVTNKIFSRNFPPNLWGCCSVLVRLFLEIVKAQPTKLNWIICIEFPPPSSQQHLVWCGVSRFVKYEQVDVGSCNGLQQVPGWSRSLTTTGRKESSNLLIPPTLTQETGGVGQLHWWLCCYSAMACRDFIISENCELSSLKSEIEKLKSLLAE